MSDSGIIASWLQVGVGFIALVLFIIVERKNIFSDRSAKSSGPSKSKRVKGNTSIQPSDFSKTENIDIRAGIYSRIHVGIIFGISFGNIYVRISNYYQHSFSRNEAAIE